ARGVKELPRADLAKAQMRRQVRGAGPIGPVACARIAQCLLIQKILQPRECAGFAGLPCLAETCRPVRRGRLQRPVLEAVADDSRSARELLWRGQRFRRVTQREEALP